MKLVNRMASSLPAIVVATLLFAVVPRCAVADEASDLQARMPMWRQAAPLCKDSVTGLAFPAKESADQAKKGDCDDGDATLFNSLLCYSGEKIACDAVAKAQVVGSGEWKRSPRYVSKPKLREHNSFSPDMALGLDLYVSTQRASASAIVAYTAWLGWIETNRPCLVTSPLDPKVCYAPGLPRFCTDDDEKGCTIRPGDYASLFVTANGLSIPFPRPVQSLQIPDIILQLLKISKADYQKLQMTDISVAALAMTFGPHASPMLEVDALVNKPGYSQHLVAVGLLIHREIAGDDLPLRLAAGGLAEKQPHNAFFAWLAGQSKQDVARRALAACPATPADVRPDKNLWIWELSDDDQTNPRSQNMLWDCIFIGNLVGRM
ncbi:hypothetical protein [Caballeronia sp. KNU42]